MNSRWFLRSKCRNDSNTDRVGLAAGLDKNGEAIEAFEHFDPAAAGEAGAAGCGINRSLTLVLRSSLMIKRV